MKSTVLYVTVATVLFSVVSAFGQSCHSGGGGGYPGGGYPGNPYPNGGGYPGGPVTPYLGAGSYPSTAQVQNFLSLPNATASATPAAPAARITVVDPAEANATKNSTAAVQTSAARITVLDEALTASTTIAKDETLDEGLKGLVGKWTAVARVGDNELTTVELRLDDRGWATLTVPGKDGKKSTIKRRVEFKNDEIKLTGPEAETLLGKLISFNSRQMVLEKAGGQVTFVRS